MPREKEAYLDNLEALKERFPGRTILKKKEVAEYCGVVPRTVEAHIPGYKKGLGYSIYTLARFLS